MIREGHELQADGRAFVAGDQGDGHGRLADDNERLGVGHCGEQALHIAGLATGDVIDFAHADVTSASASGTTLAITYAGGAAETYILAAPLPAGASFQTTSDGAGGTNVIASIPLSPLVSNSGPVPNYLVGGPAVKIGPNLALSDAESTSLQSATVSIATGFLAGDVLGFTSQPGVSGTYNAATGVLTLTGSATLAVYQKVLDSITFSSTAKDPTADNTEKGRSFSVIVGDGQQSSVPLLAPMTLAKPAGGSYSLTTRTDTISGTAGDDTVTATAGTLTAGDVINTGLGHDTLVLKGPGTFSLATPKTLSNIDVVDVSEGQAASGAISSTTQTVTMRNAATVTVDVLQNPSPNGANPNAETITITGAKDSDVFNLGGGTDTVVLGSATETVNGGAGAGVVDATAATAGALLDGGPGGLTLNISGGGAVTPNAADSGVAAINLAAAAKAYAVTLNAGFTGTLTDASAGADTITLGSAAETIDTGSGAETIKAVAATAGALITGASATATLSVAGGGSVTLNSGDSGLKTVTLQASATAYTFAANSEAGLIIDDLSGGADTLAAGGAGETITGGGAGKLTMIAASQGGDTFRDTAALLNGDTIENFATAGNVMDLTNLNFSKLKTATFTENAAGTAGVLKLSDGAHAASINLFGQFMAAGFSGTAAAAGFSTAFDGSAGTNVTYIAAPH